MMLRNITLTRWLLAACLAAAGGCAGAARSSSQDEAFLAARDAFLAGNAARIARHSAKLDRYLLKPWADYWRLKTQLEEAQAEEIRGFLESNAGTYLADTLRRDWLRVLGKTQQWERFQQERPHIASEDAEIGCYGLLAAWRQNGELPLAQLGEYWRAARELPEGCAPIAEEALRSGQFGSPQVWERFRLLGSAGQIGAARRTLGGLAREEMPSSRAFEAAAASPARFLAHRPDLRSRAARELAIMAFSRLARSDPQFTAGLWESMQERFPAQDRQYVWGQIATEAAKRHVAEAVGWFSVAGAGPLGDEQLAWRARIALRQANWTEVRNAIERMTLRASGEATWVYWQGRALRELGQAEQSGAAFARIAGERHFYGQLAAEELGRRVQLPPRAAPPTPEELAAVAANPGLQRALALYRLDLRVEGMREWLWSIRGMDDRQLLAAAELARRNEVWDRAINTADRTRLLHDYALRYPAPYGEVLSAKARLHDLEEHWVLGLVRQESRFVANARSSAGASGLMQLMPATARWVAKKVGLRDYSWSRVTDVEVNTTLGTAYLKHVLADLDDSPLLAAAGYNAGPGRARRWRDALPIEGAIYAESIPFSETRDYVKKVMADTVLYSAVLGGSVSTLKERLGVIAPRPANGPVPRKD